MDFLGQIRTGKVLIFDGAMGTQLALRGAPAGGRCNSVNPDAVEDVHRAYIDAGAHAIITNTFCMNRPYAATNKIAEDVMKLNRTGVEIARRAAGDSIAVIGDIGPTGLMLPPVGACTEEQFYEAFAEQARALADAGVDAFIIETMIDWREAAAAVRACKDNSSLPVIASMTYAALRHGGVTTMGHRAADCATQLEKAGADVLAANCGDLDPSEVAGVVQAYRSVSQLPVLVEPNAGKPKLGDGDKPVYDMLPVDFATGVSACIEAGASLAGGCCGTTPAHIHALADVLSKR